MILTVISLLFITSSIFLAHYIAPKEYNWRNNTISELAAQRYVNRKVMQAGFIGFGAFLSAAIVQEWRFGSFELKHLPILIYSVSVLLSGFFCTSPFNGDKNFSLIEARIHSFFAQLAGMAFSVGILIFFFYAEAMKLKIIHFGFFITVVFISFLFGTMRYNKGILQRVLYLVSFLWLTLFFS